MNYMPEDSYHAPGQSPYTDQNPYSGMNGGPGSVHSSRVSLHSNSSNRPRQVMCQPFKLPPPPALTHTHTHRYQNPYSGMNSRPGSVHSSRVSLHSNSSNSPRQVMYHSFKLNAPPHFSTNRNPYSVNYTTLKKKNLTYLFDHAQCLLGGKRWPRGSDSDTRARRPVSNSINLCCVLEKGTWKSPKVLLEYPVSMGGWW